MATRTFVISVIEQCNWVVFTARNCGKVMFSQACVKNFVHREDVSQHAMASRVSASWSRGCLPLDPGGIQPPGQTPPGHTHTHTHTWTHTTLGHNPPPGRHHPGHTPLWANTTPVEMTIEAGGTHPTGMHSCPTNFLSKNQTRMKMFQLRSTKKPDLYVLHRSLCD